jgi:hypothetical protein
MSVNAVVIGSQGDKSYFKVVFNYFVIFGK